VSPSPSGPADDSAGITQPPRPRGRPRRGPGWDATHKAVTFYAPLELVAALDQAVEAQGGGVKSRIIVEALRRYLGVAPHDSSGIGRRP
jgi:hypothetical protein